MNIPSTLTQQAIWKRLKKNKGAVAGLIIIIFSILIAVFSYFIAPDSSPYANRIILEIRKQKPGFRKTFLKVPKENYVKNGFFDHLLYGSHDEFEFVPINGYRIDKDSVVALKFIDDGVEEETTFAVNKLPASFITTKKFWLGTDKFGRDILSRIIIGTRVSLSVGLITLIISLSIGVLFGSLAGYFRGRVDNIIMWVINIIWSIPTLLLVFAITFALGK
jgi:peptide/nickel transport system permease protein